MERIDHSGDQLKSNSAPQNTKNRMLYETMIPLLDITKRIESGVSKI